MHRVFRYASLALLAATLLLPRGVQARSTLTDAPRLLLHVRAATTQSPCLAGITRCSEAVVEGSLYAPTHKGLYFVYLLASGYDLVAGLSEVRLGINYDQTTGSGVDIFSWHLCASAEAPTLGWFNEGGENRIDWEQSDAPHDSLGVAGYFYLTAYTPGWLALTPRLDGPATITSIGGVPAAIDTAGLGIAGFGGTEGCNPCLKPCPDTPVAVTTWGGIKNLFRMR